MILLNFSHPLTKENIEQVERSVSQAVSLVLDINSQIDDQRSLMPQIVDIVDSIELTAIQWQNEPLLVNLPGLNFSSAVLLAELHGRMGHFPTILRVRQVKGSVPTRYQVAETISLQEIRDNARRKRELEDNHEK